MDLTNNPSLELSESERELWRFPRFFTDEDMNLTESDWTHLKKVIRLKSGDKAVLCDGNGTDYLCVYDGENEFKTIKTMPNNAEPNVFLRLFQCLPKLDKMDFIVQKAVELGASEIIPVISKRCVSRPSTSSSLKKVCRWNKIAYEAAKQCGRGKVPKVLEIIDLNKAVRELKGNEQSIIFYECGGIPLKEIIEGGCCTKTINLFIGSEGGFDKGEINFANENNVITATLGKRILRAETAPITALSIIMNLTDNI